MEKLLLAKSAQVALFGFVAQFGTEGFVIVHSDVRLNNLVKVHKYRLIIKCQARIVLKNVHNR